MIIPLKKKYRSAHRGRYPGGERAAKPKKRRKLNDKAKLLLAAQPKVTLIVDGRTGKGLFVKSYT